MKCNFKESDCNPTPVKIAGFILSVALCNVELIICFHALVMVMYKSS